MDQFGNEILEDDKNTATPVVIVVPPKKSITTTSSLNETDEEEEENPGIRDSHNHYTYNCGDCACKQFQQGVGKLFRGRVLGLDECAVCAHNSTSHSSLYSGLLKIIKQNPYNFGFDRSGQNLTERQKRTHKKRLKQKKITACLPKRSAINKKK